MIDESALNKSIRDAINLIVNDASYLVIQSEQEAPRPDEPHCTVRVLSILTDSLEQWAEEDTVDDNVISHTKAMRRAMVSLKFFYGVPYNYASLVRQGLMRRSITSFLSTQGLGLGKRSAIRNETSKLENGFEERAGMDVYFSLVETDSEVIGTIETFEVTGEYYPNGSLDPLTV